MGEIEKTDLVIASMLIMTTLMIYQQTVSLVLCIVLPVPENKHVQPAMIQIEIQANNASKLLKLVNDLSIFFFWLEYIE